jgi:DNA-binding XRE family transcriptional regulator
MRENIMDNNTQFSGDELKKFRIAANLTQQELALRLGISRETVVAIENNHEKAIKPLSLKLVRNWWFLCQGNLDQSTIKSFKATLKDQLLKIFSS